MKPCQARLSRLPLHQPWPVTRQAGKGKKSHSLMPFARPRGNFTGKGRFLDATTARSKAALDATQFRPIVSPMTDDIDTSGQAELNALAMTLGIAAAVAGVGACFASGGLAILAGALAMFCLAGSVVVNASPPETPFDEYCRECDEGMTAASEGSGVSLSQEAGVSHRWRQSVAAGRQAGRRR